MPETDAQTIQIQLNGEGRSIRAGLTIRELLSDLGVPSERVAVELNRQIVRQPEWSATMVEDGAQVEIVQFVGGG